MSDFPTLLDIEAHLQTVGALVGSLPSTLAGAAEAAVLLWERDTGYLGWLPESKTYTLPVKQHYVIPPSGIIALTSIRYQSQILSSSDYQLLPVDYSALRVPAQAIRTHHLYGGEVEVEALFGWNDTTGEQVPADVWHAVLLSGCLLVSSSLTDALAGPITGVRQGDVSYTWAADGSESRIAGWRAVYHATVARYRRLVVT